MSNNYRTYHLPDAQFINFGEVVAATLPNDIKDIHNFDSTISDKYPAAIQDAIAEVKAINTDQVVIDEMTEFTQKVESAMADCNTWYKTISFFVRKAFKESDAIQNQFGLNDISKVRRNVPKMIVFMNDISSMVEKYRTVLIDAGCNENVLQNGREYGEILRVANIKQEQFKKERGVITQNRITKLNALYDLLKPISEIANIIFADNPAKLAVYQMPKPKSSTNSPDDLVVS